MWLPTSTFSAGERRLLGARLWKRLWGVLGDVSRVLRVAWYRFQGTLGRRWGGYLAVVLLIGLVGGLAMGAVAAARRTQASFPTFLASTDPSDLSVLARPVPVQVFARLAHVRRVETR